MTIKELLICCDPHMKMRLQWLGYEPTPVTDAWDVMFYASEQPDEKVRNIEVHDDVMTIQLFRKQKVKK